MLQKLMKQIKLHDTIIIHRHNRPDLDALGSQLGLANAIKSTYPDKKVYCVGDMVNKYSFIGTMDIISDDLYNNALVIIVDVAVSQMISDLRYKLAKDVFIIDHHTNKSDVTTDYLIDENKSSCAEYLAEILFDQNFIINKETATYLFGGIVTDSGRFQYSSTTPSTFRIAAKLLELGADMNYIYTNLYTESLAERKMKSYFSNKFIALPSGVAFLKNDKDVYDLFNVDFFTISRGMVSVMAGINEIKIWCNFTYDPSTNKVIGEFRSRGISIVDVAKKFGGGGHDEACGATLDSFLEADKVIEAYEQLLKENK